LAHADLGFGRASTIWRNWDDHVSYDAVEGHTISLYLRGGTGTWRTDGRHSHGWPGALCILPQGQSSRWDITQPFDFVHLYVPDAELRRSYAETFDRDARLMDVVDRTYVEAESLTRPFSSLAAAIQSGDPAMAEGAAIDLIASIFVSGRLGETRRLPVTGGLAPRTVRRLKEAIEATLDRPIRLRDLAEIADLSEFHLQRSFRDTCGVSPQTWIAHRRIDRAKALIAAGEPLIQVATACGFSSQSHFSTAFKRGTGVTPGAYRTHLG